jgi:hypothetical protein
VSPPRREAAKRRPIGPFNWFVLAGAAVNLAVVALLFFYWLTH